MAYYYSMEHFPKDLDFITNGIVTYPERRLEAYFRPISVSMKEILNKDRYLVIYIKDGDGSLSLSDGSNILYRGPSVILLDHNQEKITWNQGIRNVGFIFYFHPSLVNSRISFQVLNSFNSPDLSTSDWRDLFMLECFRNLKDSGYSLFKIDENVNSRMEYLGNQLESTLIKQTMEKWPCFSRSYIFELLITIQMIQSEAPKEADSPSLDDLKELEIYIHSNYNKAITLDSLSEKFHTNRSTLSQRFRERYGTTLKQYIIQYRIKVACSLLEKTGLTVQEISHRIGFSDSSNFNKRFKEIHAKTPGEFRKEMWCQE